MSKGTVKIKPKVLFILYNGFIRGGIQSLIMDIARELRNDYTFDVLCFDHSYGELEGEFLSFGGEIIKKSVYYEGESTFRKRADYYLRPLKMMRTVNQIIKENGPYQAIHCHNASEAGLCLTAAKMQNVPVRIAHSHTSFDDNGNVIRKIYQSFYRHLMKKNATHLIGCSQTACNTLFGEKSTKAMVVYNGIDLLKFTPQKYSLSVSNGEIKMLQVATYSENKNQTFSIQILDCLLKNGVKAKLTFIGRYMDESSYLYYEKMLKMTDDYAVWECVTFLPSDADVPRAISESNVFLFPSLREGLGIAPIEAQAMGVRCFVSDTVPKEIDCGGCFFLPLSIGANEWAEKIIEDFEETKGTHCSFDCSKFDSKRVANEFRAIYE